MSGLTAGSDAVEALLTAVGFVGLDAAVPAGPDRGVDLVLAVPDGPELAIEVKTGSLITADSAPRQVERWSQRGSRDVLQVAVADRITADARTYLTNKRWSWLDLRGHLRLTAPGLFIDTDVPLMSDAGSGRAGFTGLVSVELAVLMLLNPSQPVRVRAAAASLSRAPSSVSEAVNALRGAGLVDTANRPAAQELFWELSEHWKPTSRDVNRLPGPGQGRDNAALRLGFENVEATTGWALTDTVAAAVYGAPVATRADYPRDFYVPDEATLRRAVQLLGPAVDARARAGTVRVAPVAAVCSQRIDATTWADQEWPVAHPLFVALDLAQDPGRGREILDGWNPREPWRRVW